MNLIRAIELLDTVSNFQFKDSEKRPTVSIFGTQAEGYSVCIKTNLVNEEYRTYIEEIAKSRTLRMKGSEGYLVIYDY